jgi:hypothetical protein
LDPYAVLDHLALATCAGFVGSSFNTVQHLPQSLQVDWAIALSIVTKDLCDALEAHGKDSISVERCIKMILLLPNLCLRKPPGLNKWQPRAEKCTLRLRLSQILSNNWIPLLIGYEQDIAFVAANFPKLQLLPLSLVMTPTQKFPKLLTLLQTTNVDMPAKLFSQMVWVTHWIHVCKPNYKPSTPPVRRRFHQ